MERVQHIIESKKNGEYRKKKKKKEEEEGENEDEEEEDDDDDDDDDDDKQQQPQQQQQQRSHEEGERYEEAEAKQRPRLPTARKPPGSRQNAFNTVSEVTARGRRQAVDVERAAVADGHVPVFPTTVRVGVGTCRGGYLFPRGRQTHIQQLKPHRVDGVAVLVLSTGGDDGDNDDNDKGYNDNTFNNN